MKTTTILITQSPLKTLRVAEALRMGVGLTLCGDSVQALFVDDGVYALLQTEPGRLGMPAYQRHLDTLRQLHHRIFAERESMANRGLDKLSVEAEVLPREEIGRLLLSSDCVIRY